MTIAWQFHRHSLILLVNCFWKLSACVDPPPFFKHTFVVSIKDYELVPFTNRASKKKHTLGKTDTLTKTRRKQTSRTQTSYHIYYSSILVFFLLCWLLYLPIPPFIYATIQSASLTSQLCRKENTFPFWKHPPPQPRAIQIQFHFLWWFQSPRRDNNWDDVLAYTRVRRKQGLELSHQQLGSSPLPGASCSDLPAHSAVSAHVNAWGCPLFMPWSCQDDALQLFEAINAHPPHISCSSP